MSLREYTHRMPLTRSLFSGLHRLSGRKQDYREWLGKRQKQLATIAGLERDLWILLSSGLKHRLGKADELQVMGEISREESIRGQTLIEQITHNASLRTVRLADVRLAHPLLLDKVKSQQRKYRMRCERLQAYRGRSFLSRALIEELIPSADPIIITLDPLGQTPFVAATGNGRMQALKSSLSGDTYVELLCYAE